MNNFFETNLTDDLAPPADRASGQHRRVARKFDFLGSAEKWDIAGLVPIEKFVPVAIVDVAVDHG